MGPDEKYLSMVTGSNRPFIPFLLERGYITNPDISTDDLSYIIENISHEQKITSDDIILITLIYREGMVMS